MGYVSSERRGPFIFSHSYVESCEIPPQCVSSNPNPTNHPPKLHGAAGVTNDDSATATTTRLEWFSAERNEFSGSCGQCVTVSGWKLSKDDFCFLWFERWCFFGEVGTVSTQISAQTVSRNNPKKKMRHRGFWTTGEISLSEVEKKMICQPEVCLRHLGETPDDQISLANLGWDLWCWYPVSH